MVYKDPDYMKKWRARNKEKTRDYNKDDYARRTESPLFVVEKRKQAAAWYAADKKAGRTKRRRHLLKSLYGITPEIYDGMLAAQKGCCAICGTDRPNGNSAFFAVDHDHVTGKIRGLLCSTCNMALGLLRDSVTILRKAAAYLEQHKIS